MVQLGSIWILCIHALGAKVHVLQVPVSCPIVIRENETDNAICRVLLLINTLQFILCAAQAIIHTVFYFLMFTVIADVPVWLYHINKLVFSAAVMVHINVSLLTHVPPSVVDLICFLRL